MSNVYLVTYDISDARRLRAVYKLMRGVGVHIQYSVFRCQLSPREVMGFVARLEPLIDRREDQVLLVDLGPPDGRAASCIAAIGKPYTPLLRRATIL